MKKILVTGGNGFIGSHIVDRLVSEGHEVRVIDNLSADSNEKFYFNNKATYYNEDILNLAALTEITNGCDHIFHLAAESRIGPSMENPAKACHTNFVGTCNVLQAAKLHSVKSVVYSSTSACYGIAKKLPQKETDGIDNLNPYSVSKYAGEDLCSMFYKLWGLNTVSLRYFNVYGERMPSSGQYAPVIGIFLRQKKSNQHLTIVGDGLQSRDFIHVLDVVDANIKASINSNCYGNSYNIGSGKSYSMLNIAKLISEKYTHIAPRIGEAQDTLADTTKFSKDADWYSSIDLQEWIKSQI
jgi:UDP-glucose 4-epimerase